MRSGEVEGMREGEDSGTLASGAVRSRAMEKEKESSMSAGNCWKQRGK